MARAKQPVSINGLEFDALISEDRALEATIPEYSVEDGFTISDSIILSPERIDMTLFVTDTPVTWMQRHGTEINRAAYVAQQLNEIFLQRLPVTVVTTDAVYTNMAIASITISKTVELGTSREIPISFKKVNTTKIETTTIPDSYGKSGATGKSAGTASTSAATADASVSASSSNSSSSSTDGSSSESKSSILYGAAKSIGLL